MKLPEITPGPWEPRNFCSTTVLKYAVHEREGFAPMTVPYEIAYAKSAPGGISEREANAKAIAAVPAMLEALNEALDFVQMIEARDDTHHLVGGNIYAALRLAGATE